MLKDIDAPVKLVIAGNHDISLDSDYVLSHVGKPGAGGAWRRIGKKSEAESVIKEVKELWLGEGGRAKEEGVTFLEEGVHQIELSNGARVTVYASPYTPQFMDFGFSHRTKEDRYNNPKATLTDAKNIATNPIPPFESTTTPIDICITHGPPFRRLDQTKHGAHAGCPHLLRAVLRARPLLHCFGHIHEGWGAQRITWSNEVDAIIAKPTSIVEWQQTRWKAGIAQDGHGFERVQVDLDTAKEQHGVFVDISESGGKGLKRGEESLLVNAAIMDVRYEPTNAPWIIDLDLPKG